MESWGRRKRSIANTSEEASEEDMTLSQEILVLDFGDEKQSQFLKSNEALYSEFDKGMHFYFYLTIYFRVSGIHCLFDLLLKADNYIQPFFQILKIY